MTCRFWTIQCWSSVWGLYRCHWPHFNSSTPLCTSVWLIVDTLRSLANPNAAALRSRIAGVEFEGGLNFF
jgi:hypothetical protein